MGRYQNWRKNVRHGQAKSSAPPLLGWGRRFRLPATIVLGCLASPIFAIQVPAGTEINLRLTTAVSSSTSKVKDTVDAMVIQPVKAGGQYVIPAGAAAHGVIIESKASAGPDDRAELTMVDRKSVV